LGIQVHEILENYYLGKSTPDRSKIWRFNPGDKIYYPGKIADAMINAQIPRQPTAVEVQFDRELDGVLYTGKIDILQKYGNRIEIIDHKTSSDPKKWGKSSEDLEHDIQRNLYCWAAREGVLPVNFALNYGCTDAKPQKTLFVRAKPSLSDDYFLNEIHPVAQLMVQLKTQQINPLDLPPEPSSCELFRGCPHKQRCALKPSARVRGIIMGNSLVADLMAKAKARAGSTDKPAQKTAPAAPQLNPPEAAPVEEAKEVAEHFSGADVVKEAAAKLAPKKKESAEVAVAPKKERKKDLPTMPNLTKVAAAVGELTGIAIAATADKEVQKTAVDLGKMILENLERI
jgi:hypothetical protein